jgi:hypothetical protein
VTDGQQISGIVELSKDVGGAFREACVETGHNEQARKTLVSRHDPTVRFTNSTICVLKPMVMEGIVRTKYFLLQPALRLRNLDYFIRTGEMSAFGCYFVALGTLVAPSEGECAIATATKFLLSGVDVKPDRLVLRCSSVDNDLLLLARSTGLKVEIDGYEERRYRHVFGNEGLTGRNINFAVDVSGHLVDVGNQIVIEQDGQPHGIEIAFGISNLIACRDELHHMVDATPGVLARSFGYDTEIARDAIMSSVVLALDGLKPGARGRGGRFREFLRIVASASPGPLACSEAIDVILEAESGIRATISPHEDGTQDLSLPEAKDVLAEGLERVRSGINRG